MLEDANPYSDGIKAINCLNYENRPDKKMLMMTDIKDEILDQILEYNLEMNPDYKGNIVTTDDLILIFIYIIVKCEN